jgi:hypothetical protein
MTQISSPVIADMGGLLGLFLGCSLISLIEFFYTISKTVVEKRKMKNRVEEIRINCREDSPMKMKKILQNLESNQKEIAKRIENIEDNYEDNKRSTRKHDYNLRYFVNRRY